MKKIKQVKAWAGVVSGRVDRYPANDRYAEPGVQFEVYTTHKAARARYQHVVPVLITPIEPKPKKKAVKRAD